ncbi:MAG: tryptophanase [Deltaproteobacteria bacterium]|nr:tryptophanase [Deltaproteobacteria bacterium]
MKPLPFEPFKIKMVERIPILDRAEREKAIEAARYNPFKLAARQVTIDLLTDSGTGSMSDRQWAGIMIGDESYAGSNSYFHLQETVRAITGKKHVVPTHQGRSAENLFFGAILKPGDVVLSNTHFDTTQANVETKGGDPVNIPCAASRDLERTDPFKGDIHLEMLETWLSDKTRHVAAVIMTVTNNSNGGQPVSLANLRAAREICLRHGVPLYIDAARYAENCYFIKMREDGYRDKTLTEIAAQMFALCDGVLMSAKKDGFVNIGGYFATDSDAIFRRVCELMVVVEGFVTYGGLAGRDMEAIAIGLKEGLDIATLEQRVEQVGRLHKRLAQNGVPMIHPPGGHAVYLNANAICRHLPIERLRGWALSCELYRRGGVRAVEIGSVMFAKTDPTTGRTIYPDNDLVRLAIPRRVYTDRHIDFVAETIIDCVHHAVEIPGYEITYAPDHLKHFLAEFRPMSA